MSEDNEVYQTLKNSSRATSKFKSLQPTRLDDLVKYVPGKYKPISFSELENISEGDTVKIAFINAEDLWISVDSVDTNPDGKESGTVYGKTCAQALKVHGLQKGQRVCFDIRCVCEIKYQNDSDDDEEDSD